MKHSEKEDPSPLRSGAILTLDLPLIKQAVAYGPYAVQFLRIVDGDTVEVIVLIWPDPYQTIRTALRLNGINAPELSSKKICERKDAREAQAFVKKWAGDGNGITMTMTDLAKDKYGRLIGLLRNAQGQDLSQELLAAGYAHPYHGGTRPPWKCRVKRKGRYVETGH